MYPNADFKKEGRMAFQVGYTYSVTPTGGEIKNGHYFGTETGIMLVRDVGHVASEKLH